MSFYKGGGGGVNISGGLKMYAEGAGEYSASVSYWPPKLVYWGGTLYLNITPCTGVSPANGAYWMPFTGVPGITASELTVSDAGGYWDAGNAEGVLGEIGRSIAEKTPCGVYGGLAVSPQATPNMSVTVASGTVYTAGGARFAPAANASLAVTAADAANPRVDIVYVSSAGVISYLAGTAAASPSAPGVPSGGQLLAEIAVAAGAASVAGANIADKRKFLWAETWYSPTLINGTTGMLKIRKNISGAVEMCANLTVGTGTAGTVLTTLPVGYRPGTYYAAVICLNIDAGGWAGLKLTSDGNILLITSTPTGNRLSFAYSFCPLG